MWFPNEGTVAAVALSSFEFETENEGVFTLWQKKQVIQNTAFEKLSLICFGQIIYTRRFVFGTKGNVYLCLTGVEVKKKTAL